MRRITLQHAAPTQQMQKHANSRASVYPDGNHSSVACLHAVQVKAVYPVDSKPAPQHSVFMRFVFMLYKQTV